MQNQIVILSKPDIDFDSFLSIASKVLGYNPASHADTSSKRMTDSERMLWCLQSLKNPNDSKILTPLLKHFSTSVMVLALEHDLLEVFEICSEMPFVCTETLRRGVFLGIITGTLMQWRDSIAVGCSKERSLTIHTLFTDMYQQFVASGFQFAWGDYSVTTHNKGQILLEYEG